MTAFLLHLTPPAVSTPPEHVRAIPRPRPARTFKTLTAPPLVAAPPRDTFRLSKTSKSPPLLFSIDEAEGKDDVKSGKIKPLQPKSSQRELKAKILEGNRILAEFNRQAREQALKALLDPNQPPGKVDLVVLAKPDQADHAARLKKVPIPFHSAGFSRDVIQNLITGQFNGDFIKSWLSNRFALQVNHAKFSIKHFRQDENNQFTESALQFNSQEKSALRATARAYGYDPDDTKEMAAYYKELLQLQAEVTGGNQTQEWGIAFQYKKGVFKTKPLALPQ